MPARYMGGGVKGCIPFQKNKTAFFENDTVTDGFGLLLFGGTERRNLRHRKGGSNAEARDSALASVSARNQSSVLTETCSPPSQDPRRRRLRLSPHIVPAPRALVTGGRAHRMVLFVHHGPSAVDYLQDTTVALTQRWSAQRLEPNRMRLADR